MSHTYDVESNEGNEVEEQLGEHERASLDDVSAGDSTIGVVMKPGPDCPVG
jgi:hypothetical protein